MGSLEGNWKEFKGKVQQKWGELTSDDLDVIEGKRKELTGRLQQRYGYAKDQAEREIDTWLKGNLAEQPGAPPARWHKPLSRRDETAMFRRSRYSRAISADIGEIERRCGRWRSASSASAAGLRRMPRKPQTAPAK